VNNIWEFLVPRCKGGEPRVIFEIGAHIGTDTATLATLPGATVHAFEPDPRNNIPVLPNVIFNRAAVAAKTGTATFTPSAKRDAWDWTCSGSLRTPKEHLKSWPTVTFGEPITVPTITLDDYCREHGIGEIDCIWADVQGAEVDVIEGGRETLKRTRYLYTEFSWKELYEGQVNLDGILALLPGWRVVHVFPSPEDYGDVLLENTALAGR
jgi:FkbM family methyltransferase